MAIPMVVIGKLNLLLLLSGSHCGHLHIMVSLLCPFILKLSLAARLPTSFSQLAVSLRLFLFRLRRILLADDDAALAAEERRHSGRWERALRLLLDRAVAPSDHTTRLTALAPNDEILNSISMLTL